MSETVRIRPETHAKLRALSERTGEAMPDLLDKAVEIYRRRQFLAECNRAFRSLKDDPAAWAEELKERQAWDSTLSDGLEDES
jgi:hypothetical protein